MCVWHMKRTNACYAHGVSNCIIRGINTHARYDVRGTREARQARAVMRQTYMHTSLCT